jgi:cyanophycinase
MKDRNLKLTLSILFLSFITPIAEAQTFVGSRPGALIIQGAGDAARRSPQVWERFISLAGGPDANFVFIPTADEPVDLKNLDRTHFPFARLKHVTVLHTRCRSEADTEAFVAPLRKATGVWFGPGKQFRLADSYLHTRTQRELQGVLNRGGVIGGLGAGGVILVSYTVRGGILDDKVMMAKSHEEGLGYLENVAIDQRIDIKTREADMVAVIAAHPELLGLGLEESTAIVVRGAKLEVIGPGRVAVTDGKDHNGKPYYYLSAGERFDLKRRAKL